MDSDYLRSIGYEQRDEYDDKECCHCRFRNTKKKDSSQLRCFCERHNMYVGPEDVCRDFFDIMDALDTPEGQELRERVAQMAAFYSQMDRNEQNASNKTETNKEGCYIATAVYGGYDKPEVQVLRKYRDNVLRRTFLGRIFIKLYYLLSPGMARKLKEHRRLNAEIKKILDKIVYKLEI